MSSADPTVGCYHGRVAVCYGDDRGPVTGALSSCSTDSFVATTTYFGSTNPRQFLRMLSFQWKLLLTTLWVLTRRKRWDWNFGTDPTDQQTNSTDPTDQFSRSYWKCCLCVLATVLYRLGAYSNFPQCDGRFMGKIPITFLMLTMPVDFVVFAIGTIQSCRPIEPNAATLQRIEDRCDMSCFLPGWSFNFELLHQIWSSG